MEARDRFISALAKAASTAYYADGELYLAIEEIGEIAKAEKVPDAEARAVLDLLDERGLLQREEGGWAYGDGIGLVLEYEQTDRRLFWRRNVLRREILRLAAIAYDEGKVDLSYREGEEHFVDAPWAEAYAASKSIEHLGLVEVHPFLGHNFDLRITPSGRELQRDRRALDRELPTSAADDEHAGADIAPDALQELILDVEGLLAERAWAGAARELGRADERYREGQWIDAVREYYAWKVGSSIAWMRRRSPTGPGRRCETLRSSLPPRT